MPDHSPDAVKRAVVVGIFANSTLMDRLTLKGGTALEYGYNITTRASRDIDLSMEGEFDSLMTLNMELEQALSIALNELGLAMIEFSVHEKPSVITDDIKEFWGGYEASFKVVPKDQKKPGIDDVDLRDFALSVTSTGGKWFSIDISRHEAIVERWTFELDGYTGFIYSPAMLVAEKLRAICQQTVEYNDVVHRVRKREDARRGRDFLDIYDLCTKKGVDVQSPKFHELLRMVFRAKRVDLTLLDKIEEYEEFHKLDFEKTKDTVGPDNNLSDFHFYFTYVTNIRNLLRPLWIVDAPT